jgi:hypothetical protein
LCHVYPLPGSDREISNYTTAISKRRPLNSNRGMVFLYGPCGDVTSRAVEESVSQSVSQSVGQLDNHWGLVVSCCCYKLVAEAWDSSGTRRKGTSAVGSSYQATASEDCKRLRRHSVFYSDL